MLFLYIEVFSSCGEDLTPAHLIQSVVSKDLQNRMGLNKFDDFYSRLDEFARHGEGTREDVKKRLINGIPHMKSVLPEFDL